MTQSQQITEPAHDAAYPTLRAFYDDDLRRCRSEETDYGSLWRVTGSPYTWRVSYVKATGEIYAVQLRRCEGPVYVLGVVPPDPEDRRSWPRRHYYDTLDRVLEGHPKAARNPDAFGWIRGRINAHQNDALHGADI